MARNYRPEQEYRPAPMSLAQRAALRSQPPRALRQPARRRVYPLAFLGALLVLLAVAVAGAEYRYRDRVYPNVRVQPGNIDLGGQTQGEAMDSLRQYALAQHFRNVTLRPPAGDHAPITVPAYTLGYSFDRGLTAFHAIRTGRDGDLAHRAAFQLGLLVHPVDIPAVQRVNRRALRDYLFKLTGLTDRRPGPGTVGYRLDVARAQDAIARRLPGDGPITVSLPVATIPALPKPAHPSKGSSHKKGH